MSHYTHNEQRLWHFVWLAGQEGATRAEIEHAFVSWSPRGIGQAIERFTKEGIFEPTTRRHGTLMSRPQPAWRVVKKLPPPNVR